ncbi:MAG TPA: penicillin-binding protein 2 [Bdellovibrionota bacterium]|nr:penicillin-binding protein 2 [Bdellovibrionota bacterium]
MRRKVLFGFFVAGFGAILARTLQLQLFPGSRLNALMERNLARDISLVGRRGTLRDRNGAELAVSVDSLSVFIDPKLFPKKRSRDLMERISRVTGLSVVQLNQKIQENRKRRFVWIRRQLDTEAVKLWSKLKLSTVPGLGALPEFRRVYPFDSLASQVLGFVSVDGRGLEAAERGFDKDLGGERLRVRVPTDAKGRPVFKQEEQVQFREMAGKDMVLSLDHRIQFAAERALKSAIDKHRAHAGSVVVMDPHTGEMLAMASLPTFDPNLVGESESSQRRNRIVSDWFEPGSVVKPLVVLEGLNRGLFSPKTIISGGGGSVRIGRKVITEADTKHYFDKISVHDTIKFSSNVGMVSLVQRFGFDFVQDALTKLSFGKRTGIDLPSETAGLFRIPKAKQNLEKATISYGHGIAVTPLQLASAYSVIANGGFEVKPTVLKVDETHPAVVKNRKALFSKQAIAQVRGMLSAVVNDGGTGTTAALDTVAVAGKTGTAWKVDTEAGGYKSRAYVSSFAGYFPAEEPRFVIAVSIDEPSENGYYGGAVAGPVVKEVAFEIMRFSESFRSPIVNVMAR